MDKKLNSEVFNPQETLPYIADETDVIVDKIIEMVKGYSPKANTDIIYVAYRMAKAAHKSVLLILIILNIKVMWVQR